MLAARFARGERSFNFRKCLSMWSNYIIRSHLFPKESRGMKAPPASAPLRRGHLGKIFLCFSDLRATEFSLKKEKEILPRCSALKNSGGRGYARTARVFLLHPPSRAVLALIELRRRS